jgi:hypothetical protein
MAKSCLEITENMIRGEKLNAIINIDREIRKDGGVNEL